METSFAATLACVNCKKNFVLSEARNIVSNRMPVMLPCGHSICVGCVSLFRNGSQCKECGIPAQRQLDIYRTGFPPHLGIIGGLVVATDATQVAKVKKMQSTPQYLPAGAPLKPQPQRKRTNTVEKQECDECQFDVAFVHCSKCVKYYCVKCMDLRHGPAEQKTHQVVLLSGPRLQLPAVPLAKPRRFCSVHSNEKLEYLCQDCKVTICAQCCLREEGGHHGHRVTFMADLGAKCKPKINEMLLEVEEVQRHLEFTMKALRDGGSLSAEWIAADKKISGYIAWQLAQVQRAGMVMRLQLADAAKAKAATRNELVDDVVQNLERVRGLAACGSSCDPGELHWLMENLEEACTLPCQLHKQSSTATVRFSVDKEAFLDALEIGATLELPEEDADVAVLPLGADIADGWTLLEDCVVHDSPVKRRLLPRNSPPTPAAHKATKTAANALLAALEQPATVSKGVRSNEGSVGSVCSELELSPIRHGFIPPGTSEVVRISHVVDPFDFYVVRIPDETYRNKLTKKIQAKFRKLVEPEMINFGDIVLAKYMEDGLWYRAQISATELPAPHVLFIDYGNSVTAGAGCIRALPDDLATVPPLAIRCRLAKAHPRGGGEWSNAAIQWFINIADGNRLLCRVYSVENGKANVDVGEVPGAKQSVVPLSVADASVFAQFAQFIVEPAVNDLEMDLPSGFERRPEVSFPQPRRWHINEHFVAQVSHVELADRFYVHRQDAVGGARIVRYNDELTALCRPLFNAAGDGENLPVHLPKEGLLCAALFAIDSMWYRAIIKEVLPERIVKVFYVDYGNSDVVSIDNIRHLPPRFAKDPPLAIECHLHGIVPANGAKAFSIEAAEMVDDLTKDQVIELTVREVLDEPTRYAVLAVNRKGVNVARELTQAKLAVRCGSESAVQTDESDTDEDYLAITLPPLPEPHTRRSESRLTGEDGVFPRSNGVTPLDDMEGRRGQAIMEDVVHMPIRAESVTDASLTEIVFVKCVTPDQIYISLASAVINFSDMKTSMDLYYAKSVPTDRTWVPGERCAALRASDRCWHRGIVRDVDDNAGVALVELRDIVCRERVPLSLLRVLDESFMRVREAIFTVSLGGVLPAGGTTWTRQAGEFATRFTTIHTPTHIIKRGEITDGKLPVELLARESVMSGPLDPTVERYVSLNKELVANGLALPVRGAQEWPTWSSVEVVKEVEESKEAADWTFPDQVAEDKEVDLWPGVPTDRPLQPGGWLPIEANDMVSFEAVPTNVDYNGYIYLHSVHAETTLQSMTAQLQRHFGDTPPPPSNFALVPGMPCITRFHLDNMWYRSETVRELPDGRWDVIFVDYGSRDILPASEIWPTTFLSEIPVLCRKVALADIQPISEDGRWSRDGLDKLHVNIVMKNCTVHQRCPIGTPDPITVLLVRSDDGAQIGALMVELGVARFADVKPGMVPGLPPHSKRRSRRARSSDDSKHGLDGSSELGSEFLSERDSDCSFDVGPAPEQDSIDASHDNPPSPDVIECFEDVEEDLSETLFKQLSLNESLDLHSVSEKMNLKIVPTDDSMISNTDIESIACKTKDRAVDDKSSEMDDETCSLNGTQEVGTVLLGKNTPKADDADAEISVDFEEPKSDELVEDDSDSPLKVTADDDSISQSAESEEQDQPMATSSPKHWADESDDESDSSTSTNSTVPLEYKRYPFPAEDLLNVVVQSMESSLEIRFIPQDPLSLRRLEKLRELRARMQEQAPSQPLLQHRNLQTACIAQFSDGEWNRVIFTNIIGKSFVVWDVDGSRWENVSPDRVRECRREWLALPTLLYAAKLPGLTLAPSFSAEPGINALRHSLIGNKFTARVLCREPKLAVELYVEGTTTSALAPLIESGIVEAIDID